MEINKRNFAHFRNIRFQSQNFSNSQKWDISCWGRKHLYVNINKRLSFGAFRRCSEKSQTFHANSKIEIFVVSKNRQQIFGIKISTSWFEKHFILMILEARKLKTNSPRQNQQKNFFRKSSQKGQKLYTRITEKLKFWRSCLQIHKISRMEISTN